MMRAINRENERGAALLAAICFTVVVLGLGLATANMASQEGISTRNSGDVMVMRNVAEAGIDRALNKMGSDPMWRCTGSPTDYTDNPLAMVVAGTSTSLGTYTVDPIEDMGGDYVQVTAHGYTPSADAPGRQAHQVRVIAYKCWSTPFSAAAFGRAGVPLANGDTDSYNSATGGYGAQPHGNKGDIRTDSTDPGSITIKNNGYCGGNVIYGPGTNLNNVTLDRSRVSGGIMAAPSSAVSPDVVVPGSAVAISTINGGSNTITGTLTIPAGTWYCDGISISGQSQVSTTGRVILYVKGNMSIGGKGIINNGDSAGGAALPSNLQILGTPDCTSVSISGNGALTAAVYVPEANIVLNGGGSSGSVFGSLSGSTVSFNGNGTVLHYDEALQSVTGVVTGFRPKSWEEEAG